MASSRFRICLGAFILNLLIFLMSIYIFVYFYTNALVNKKLVSVSGEMDAAIGPPVFLVETKVGKLHLTSREACALEAAARRHPRSDVTLYTVNSHFNSSDIFTETIVSNLPNVHIHHLNLSQLFEGSPLSTWYKKNSLNSSLYPVQHLSDAVRLVLLWKRGGIYMDTDAIALKDHSPLRNSLGMESDNDVVNGVLVFDQLSPFLFDCLTDLAENYNGSQWAANGPKVVTKIARRFCNISGSFNKLVLIVCPSVNLRPRNTFYPPTYNFLFKPLRSDWFANYSSSYSLHLYGNLTRQLKAKPNDGTFIDAIFRRHCPTSYQIMVQLDYI